VGPRAGLDVMVKRKILPLPEEIYVTIELEIIIMQIPVILADSELSCN